MVITGFLFVVYEFFILSGIKKRHNREMAASAATPGHEGLVEKFVGMAMAPALEPESVV